MDIKNGIQIIGDLYGCNFKNFVKNKKDLAVFKKIISQKIKKSGLSELGNFYYFFKKNSITGVIALAESHISFHTWPESLEVNLDVYVCNYSKDHSFAAKNIFNYLSKEIFKCKKMKRKIIYR